MRSMIVIIILLWNKKRGVSVAYSMFYYYSHGKKDL